MGGIYKRASLVFIWLGERAEADLIGVVLMKYICGRLEEDNLDYTFGPPDPSFFGIIYACLARCGSDFPATVVLPRLSSARVFVMHKSGFSGAEALGFPRTYSLALSTE
jgi:hypothetical protein